MSNLIDGFIGYLFSKTDSAGPEVYQKAADCVEDYRAVAAAGERKNERRWRAVLENSPGPAEVIGSGKTTDPKTAALINGFNAHTLELDDGQRFAMIHLGAAVISAIFSAAAGKAVSEKEILRGVIAGYEAACRTALCMQPAHKKRGFHTAGTCGTIGAAVGAAFATGCRPEQMKTVLSCAVGSAAGMLELQEQSSELKPYNLGRAAMDGYTAAEMGTTGFACPDDMLGGERGFFKLFAGEFDERELTGDKPYFEIERIYVKPYASCRHSHSAIEAALKIGKSVDRSAIGSVSVRSYDLAVRGHDHQTVCGSASAKLSTPYAVAAALLYGRADLSVFEPVDPGAAELAKRVSVTEDPRFTALCPAMRAAEVTVYMKDGTEKTERVDYAKGEPENPMTKEEFSEKIAMLRAYAQSADR